MEKLENSGIYMILNTVNMKIYIGSSVNLKERKRKHFRRLVTNKHCNPHLQKSFNKYGKDVFTFIILERGIDREDLFLRENYHIKQKDSLNQEKGYNMAIPTKDSNMKLRPQTLELKRRIAYKQYFGETSEEDYQKWYQNKYHPKKKEPSIHPNAKPLKSITKEGIETRYSSLAYAAKVLGSNEEFIRRALRGQNKTHKGMRWEHL